MINFIDGKIDLGVTCISVAAEYEDLNTLAKEGILEKRKDPHNSGPYFYVESVADGIRFGIVISLNEKRIDYILVRWLDSPMKGWDDVSEKALKDEYRLLLNFVEKSVGSAPDKKGTRQRTWRFKWGQVDVSYEPRSFDAVIFMKAR